MKKLMVLVMVFAMASLASATLQISINGDQQAAPITLQPSQTAVLDIWSDATLPVNQALNLVIVSTTGSTINFLSGDSVLNPAQQGVKLEHGGNATWFLGAEGILPAGEEGMGGYIVNTVGPISTGGTIFDGIILHCDAPGDVMVKLYMVPDEFDRVILVDEAVIHQIPEPVTIALLGLGGLFLRRRMS